MTLLAVTPEVEGALIAFLRTDPDVTAARTVSGHAGGVSWTLGASPVYPFLRVFRVGGPAVDAYLDRPLMQLEAIGSPNDQSSTGRQTLSNLLRIAHAAVLERARWATHSGVRFSTVETVTHLQWAPDDETRQARYLSRLTMAAHRVD